VFELHFLICHSSYIIVFTLYFIFLILSILYKFIEEDCGLKEDLFLSYFLLLLEHSLKDNRTTS